MDNRKIDQLIAEKIMGWNAEKRTATTYWAGEQGEWRIKHLWKPTENMEDAWDVVEKLRENYWIQIDVGKEYVCDIGKYGVTGSTIQIEANTAPLVICKASLKLIEVEV